MKSLDIKVKDVSGVHTWLVLFKTAHAVGVEADRSIDGLGMCGADFRVLEALLHKGPLPVNTIGKKVSLTSGSITTAIDRLEEKDLVTRKSDPEDRRARMVHLTPAGRKLIEKAFEKHADDMERVASVLTEKERGKLIRLLRRLGRAAANEQATKGISI